MVIMRKIQGCIVFLLFVAVIINFVPPVDSQEVDVEWHERFTFEGSCSSGNIPHRFSVNRTVVEIEINISWPSGDGSDLNFWIENRSGLNVDASDSFENPEIMNIRTISERGRWTLWIYPQSCGSSGQVNYTANVTLRNVVLPELMISVCQIEKGENVSMSVSSAYDDVMEYFLDFGDGTKSGWSTLSGHTKTYNESGEYTPRARVRYSEGTESDWVEAGTIEVAGEEGVPSPFPWVAFWLIVISLALFLVSLRYDKKRGF